MTADELLKLIEQYGNTCYWHRDHTEINAAFMPIRTEVERLHRELDELKQRIEAAEHTSWEKSE